MSQQRTSASGRLLAVVGPTASGKTTFAAHLALAMGGEVLSADSRQVYRRMTIGTGKDLADYEIGGQRVPYHLVDIVEPGEKYNVYRYQMDFAEAYTDVVGRGKTPILCGGSGLYVEAVLKNYSLLSVPPNPELRAELAALSMDELAARLSTYQELHNVTDLDNRRRTVRAIEIADYLSHHKGETGPLSNLSAVVFGVDIDRELRRQRITSRLKDRLEGGMVDEVRSLLAEGIPAEDLIYYGLEYKYVTLFCVGRLGYEEMVSQLEIAIHQFAKRQMTWFRGMERRGTPIHWIDFNKTTEEKIAEVQQVLDSMQA